MTTPCGMTLRSIRSTAGMFGQECAKPGCVSSSAWTRPSRCSSRGAMCACADVRRHYAKRYRPKGRRPSPRAQPASPKARAVGWRTSPSGGPPRCPMLVAEHRRRGQWQKDRRAKPARRSSRLRYPKTAAQRLHQSRSAHKNQNPQNGQLMARFDWGSGAICFGASPVAAVFGSAPGSATPPEHRIHFKPSSPTAPLKQDISTLLGIGHFYFALTQRSMDIAAADQKQYIVPIRKKVDEPREGTDRTGEWPSWVSHGDIDRSEERRVGKECRSRWS